MHTIEAEKYCDSVRDGTHDTPRQVEYGYRLVTAKHINNGQIDLSNAYYISESDYLKICERSKVEKWDVLMSMIGNGLGKSAVVKDNPDYAIKNLALFKIGDEIKAKWLHYYLSSFEGQSYIYNSLQGSGQPFISLSILRKFPIPIPDNDSIMRRIVVILSRYDSLIENYQRQIKLLEEAAQRLYKEWFVDLHFPGHESTPIINNLPQAWQKKKISDVCDTIGGGTPSTKVASYYEGGTIKWVTPTDITQSNSLCILDTEKKITQEGLNNSSAKMLPPETILMTSRASVGFFGICDFEVCTNQGFISCVPFNKDYQMYLLFNLKNRVDEIRGKAGGSTYLEISKRVFRDLDIVCPEAQVLSCFQEQVHRILEMIRNNTIKIRDLSEARDRLLPKLMSAEIEV